MTSGTVLLLALTLKGGWAADGQTDQRAVARLGAAARKGDVERVVTGAKGLPPELLDVVAQEAVCGGQPAVLRAVVALGARPKVFGRGALRCMLALRVVPGIGPNSVGHPVLRSYDDAPLVEMVRLVVKEGADLRTPFDDAGTIVVAAASTCRPALLRAVLEADVDVNARAWGVTPLDIAARCSGEMTDLLLARGGKGLEKAAAGELARLVSEVREPQAFRTRLAELLPRGARALLADGTALSLAAERGNPAAVSELMAAGADPNARDRNGDAPLHVVAERCWRDCEAVARALLDAGAKRDAVGAARRTPYELASKEGHAPLLGHLLASFPWKPLAPLGATATASGVLVEKARAADRYVPARALDGAPATCWCVRGAALPRGETFGQMEEDPPGKAPVWIELHLARPAVLRALRIYPGCGDDPKIYAANDRVAVLKVTMEGEPQQRTLPDAMRYQDLGVRSAGAVDRIRIDVEAVHRGAKYDDTCIAEVQAVLE